MKLINVILRKYFANYPDEYKLPISQDFPLEYQVIDALCKEEYNSLLADVLKD